jgi:hypothetical protein
MTNKNFHDKFFNDPFLLLELITLCPQQDNNVFAKRTIPYAICEIMATLSILA